MIFLRITPAQRFVFYKVLTLQQNDLSQNQGVELTFDGEGFDFTAK